MEKFRLLKSNIKTILKPILPEFKKMAADG